MTRIRRRVRRKGAEMIVEWTGKKLKEYRGELDSELHSAKQKGLSQWRDLLRRDDQNPDLAIGVNDSESLLLVRLSAANQTKAQNDSRTIYEDGGKYWGVVCKLAQ
jgi:hypothetical protein